MEVVGPLLMLRYAMADDAPALLELGADAEVTRFFSWGPYTSVAQPAHYIARLVSKRASGERLEFLIVDPGRGPIGVVGLSEFSQRDRRAVVGTWLGRRWWGTGANRSSKALIAWLAFKALGLERLGAYADLDNPRSQAALASLGFQREGLLRRWHRHGEHPHDVIIYSWLREEWERSPLAQEPITVRGAAPSSFVAPAAATPGAGPS